VTDFDLSIRKISIICAVSEKILYWLDSAIEIERKNNKPALSDSFKNWYLKWKESAAVRESSVKKKRKPTCIVHAAASKERSHPILLMEKGVIGKQINVIPCSRQSSKPIHIFQGSA
jgi:hypothetical protein